MKNKKREKIINIADAIVISAKEGADGTFLMELLKMRYGTDWKRHYPSREEIRN